MDLKMRTPLTQINPSPDSDSCCFHHYFRPGINGDSRPPRRR